MPSIGCGLFYLYIYYMYCVPVSVCRCVCVCASKCNQLTWLHLDNILSFDGICTNNS